MARRESVTRMRQASQSESSGQTVRTVTVAVLPPRLPSGMAPPTGLGAAEAFSWDEALNWQHNDPMEQQEPGRRKSFFRKLGVTTQRKRSADEDDLPPFVMRQIPYDIWRRHYAKDANGYYRGTEDPAGDCLLKPEDLQKWRGVEEPVTKADQWVRGTRPSVTTPEHSPQENTGGLLPPSVYESFVTPGGDRSTEHFNEQHTIQNTEPTTSDSARSSSTTRQTGRIIADGKTAADIIAEADARPKQKMTWREKFSKGSNTTMLGS